MFWVIYVFNNVSIFRGVKHDGISWEPKGILKRLCPIQPHGGGDPGPLCAPRPTATVPPFSPVVREPTVAKVTCPRPAAPGARIEESRTS